MNANLVWVVHYRSPARPNGELVASDRQHAEELRRAVIQSGWESVGEMERVWYAKTLTYQANGAPWPAGEWPS